MKKTTHILFTIYIFLVIWIILFKLSVSIDQLPHFRSINLIPFYYPNKTTYQIREVLDNLIIFIPFGLYLKTLNINIPTNQDVYSTLVYMIENNLINIDQLLNLLVENNISSINNTLIFNDSY